MKRQLGTVSSGDASHFLRYFYSPYVYLNIKTASFLLKYRSCIIIHHHTHMYIFNQLDIFKTIRRCPLVISLPLLWPQTGGGCSLAQSSYWLTRRPQQPIRVRGRHIHSASIVNNGHVTSILASDWSILVTRPQSMPLIGKY